MKRNRKVHHFTAKELLLERVLIIALVCLLGAVAFAATTKLPVQVEILQCGPRDALPQMCLREERCCALLDLAQEAEEAARDHPRTPLQSLPPRQ